MASSLAAALMGGNDAAANPMLGIDPSIATALPNYQLGNEMQQQGLSTAPAYPAVAISRLGQALLGTYIKSSALSDLNKASANLPSHLADIIERTQPGSPLPPMLRSDDPAVRMTGLQMVQKIVPLQAELQKTGPNQNVSSGGTTMYSNQNPRTGVAQSAADAENADARGDKFAVDAITRNINKENTIGDTGVQPPPIPLPGLSAAARQPGGSPSPSAAIPQPMPKPDVSFTVPDPNKDQSRVPLTVGPMRAPAQSTTQAIASAKGLQTQEQDTAAANVKYGDLRQPQGNLPKGPGLTDPMQTDHGTVLPPLAAQQPVPTTPAELDQRLPVWTKTTTDWNTSLAPGYAAEQRLQTIANAFKQIQGGAFDTDKANFLAGLNAAGIPISQSAMNNAAAVQTALHENYIKTMQQLKASNSRWTQMEFKATSENSEHPNLQPAANLQMLSEDLATLRQGRDLATDWTPAQRNGWRDPQSFESEWLKNNPLSDYVNQARQQIGPLKGMSQSSALPRFNAPADVHAAIAAKKLSSGQQFVMPDGRIGTVP